MFTPQRFVVRTSLTGYGRLASIVCLTLLLYATSSSNCSTFAQTEKTKRELPSLTLLGNETRALLRQEAVLKSGPEKNAAATALCDMYVILRLDSRYGGSKMLQGDATRIRRRLISIANSHEKQLKRDEIPRPPKLSSEVTASIAAAITKYQKNADDNNADDNAPAAGTGNPADNPNNDQRANSNEPENGDQSSRGGDHTNDQNPTAGQPAQGTGGAQAAAGVPDTGWQLVELIQRVIAPDFWESRGGPGSIRYFAMRKVLVIRATTDVHEQVRDLLTALR